MIKKVSAGAAVFVVVFIISVWLMFPYQNIVGTAVQQAGKNSSLKITYNDVSAGPFSTTFSELEINGVPVESLKASYSPLSIITRSLGVQTTGLIEADAELSPSKTEYTAEISQSVINSLAGGKANFSAPLKVAGTGNPAKRLADFKASIAKIEIETPMGKLPFENLEADISVNGMDITVNSLTSKDDMNLNMKGFIRVNSRNIGSSVMNINGNADIFGQQKKVTVMGRFDNLQSSIN